jgi:hypothetical protein
VTRSGIGTDVVEQQLAGRSDTVAVGTRVAFWTHVTGGRTGDTVRHVWSHQGTTAGAVDLWENPRWGYQRIIRDEVRRLVVSSSTLRLGLLCGEVDLGDDPWRAFLGDLEDDPFGAGRRFRRDVDKLFV